MRVLGVIVFGLLTLLAWALHRVLERSRGVHSCRARRSARSWSANVFFVIIPGQKKMVEAMRAGELPDPIDGKRGKQRSVHNNYFTLPVLFIMISNHYASTYASRVRLGDPCADCRRRESASGIFSIAGTKACWRGSIP